MEPGIITNSRHRHAGCIRQAATRASPLFGARSVGFLGSVSGKPVLCCKTTRSPSSLPWSRGSHASSSGPSRRPKRDRSRVRARLGSTQPISFWPRSRVSSCPFWRIFSGPRLDRGPDRRCDRRGRTRRATAPNAGGAHRRSSQESPSAPGRGVARDWARLRASAACRAGGSLGRSTIILRWRGAGIFFAALGRPCFGTRGPRGFESHDGRQSVMESCRQLGRRAVGDGDRGHLGGGVDLLRRGRRLALRRGKRVFDPPRRCRRATRQRRGLGRRRRLAPARARPARVGAARGHGAVRSGDAPVMPFLALISSSFTATTNRWPPLCLWLRR